LKKQLSIWLLFAFCMLLLFGVLGWLTATVLRLDRERAQTRRQAAFEETVRLAMWRMDSALSSLVGIENARPYFMYNSFYPSGRAYTRMFARLQPGEVLFPSPLLTESSEHIHLHFQFGPDGLISSPQVPAGNMQDLAESGYVTHEQVESAAAVLKELGLRASREALHRLLPADSLKAGKPVRLPPLAVARQQEQPSSLPRQQIVMNSIEWQARSKAYMQAANLDNNPAFFAEDDADVVQGMMQPVWMDELLLIVRKVVVGDTEYVQGCWLDWESIRTLLKESIDDLLPDSRLVPAPEFAGAETPRTLATLPVRLEPGNPPALGRGGLSPMKLTLLIGWVCVVLAALAAAALLGGALALSERRSAFVSAVTHELRTPLTTFRMYTEMLAEGMVAGEEERAGYLATLRSEAERLAHLVENVLAYARLEKNRAGGTIETVPVSLLLDRFGARLTERAVQAGMTLDIDPGDAAGSEVRADLSAVERILLNLVDNACKFASDAENRTIHLTAEVSGPAVLMRVRDHGPGVSAADRRRMFKPFSKSASEAANSKPGVGLGLTLSRKLARKMGGELFLDSATSDGACFVLTVPQAHG